MAKEDLIPLSMRTKEEQKKIQSAGGIASGKSRRKKKAAREAAALFLSLPAPNGHAEELMQMGVSEEDANFQMAIIAGLAIQAASGNHNAAKLLFELSGDMEKGQVEETESSGLIEALNNSASDVFGAGDDSAAVADNSSAVGGGE